MSYALSLILWMATAQTAAQPPPVSAAAPAAVPIATPASPPSDAERALRAQLDEARRKLADANEQLAELEEEAGMPDHAVAALLVSDRPDLAKLERITSRNTAGGGAGESATARLRSISVLTLTKP